MLFLSESISFSKAMIVPVEMTVRIVSHPPLVPGRPNTIIYSRPQWWQRSHNGIQTFFLGPRSLLHLPCNLQVTPNYTDTLGLNILVIISNTLVSIQGENANCGGHWDCVKLLGCLLIAELFANYWDDLKIMLVYIWPGHKGIDLVIMILNF